ncbi:hypothetical protein F2Q70_00012495 [Brassica cretica]|uniref:Uncharacterized protein n=1 Tax=Brassica cretica TaxID=69181 RepID=A0A8S9M327_BRACR|nr:hypothetical protein F2Q70_00012495 [Brassica cretica]
MHVVIVPVESSSGAFTVCNGGGSLLSMEGRRDSWRDGGDESRLLGPKVREACSSVPEATHGKALQQWSCQPKERVLAGETRQSFYFPAPAMVLWSFSGGMNSAPLEVAFSTLPRLLLSRLRLECTSGADIVVHGLNS